MIADELTAVRRLVDAMLHDAALIAAVERAGELVSACFRQGGKVMLVGNGGSAGDAQHVAAEFLSRFERERRPLPAIALTTDTSAITAIGNDFGFEQVFARQVRALGRPGDVLVAMSTSGTSRNVIAALEAAREGGVTRIGLQGSKVGPMTELCDCLIAVPSARTALVQQGHLMIGHILCGLCEAALGHEDQAGR